MRPADLAKLLDVQPEAAPLLDRGEAAPDPEAQRLSLQLDFLADQLSDVYTPRKARRWLQSRQRLLDGQAPIDLLRTGRSREVMLVIRRLRDSVDI
jgi:hypothetical protein